MNKLYHYLWQLAAVVMLTMAGSMQANADELTVFDGTDIVGYQPFYAEYGDCVQRHEFIIPASELTAMKDAVVKKMTFYSSSNSLTPSFTFKVFLKEVEQTTFDRESFIGDEGGTTVYEGKLVVANSLAEFQFTNDYEYKGGNLMIGFYTLTQGNYSSCGFYGQKFDGDLRATMGISFSADGDYTTLPTPTSNYLNEANFIPKTTFTYEAASTPAPNEIANIAALKSYELTSASEDVLLNLSNAKVTYVNAANDVAVVEDETAAYNFMTVGMSSLVEAGQTLNGKLALTISEGWMENAVALTNGLDGVTVTNGEATPLVLTEENAQDYANNYDWRYVQIPNVTLAVTEGDYKEYSMTSELLGEDPYAAVTTFYQFDDEVVTGTVGTITGFLASYYGMMLVFYPIDFEAKVETPVKQLANLAAYKNFEFDPTATEGEDVELTLNNVKVTYVNTTEDAVMMEDESAGVMIAQSNFSTLFATGQTLNGTLKMNLVDNVWVGTLISLPNGLEGVTITEGTHEPMLITEENAQAYANDYDWRYVSIPNVTLHAQRDDYGITYSMVSEFLGENEILVLDSFQSFDKKYADGTVGTITGYLANHWGLGFFALKFEEKQEAEPTVIENVAALKNFTLTNPDAETEDVVLVLNNVQITAVSESADYVVFEDESAGYILENSGLAALVQEGQILNGELALTAVDAWFMIEFTVANGLEGVTVTDGELSPIVVTADNVDAYKADFEWRLAQIDDVVLTGATDDNGKYYTMQSDVLGATDIMIFDRFFAMDKTLEDGTVGTITGFRVDLYSIPCFYVTDFKVTATGINNVNTTETTENDVIYNINGQRLSMPTRGINIINGKKVLIK